MAESFMHIVEAATESWAKRPISRTFFFGIHCSGAKPFTSPAMRAGNVLASKSVMGPMPERASSTDVQVSSVPIPFGVTRPMPVMTTRSMSTSPAFGAAASSAAERSLIPAHAHDGARASENRTRSKKARAPKPRRADRPKTTAAA
jgi:hypothetical protein